MAGAAQRVERLRRIPLFADLSLSALSEIARVAKEMDVPAGRVLIEPNQTGSGLYVIEDGVVEVEARRPLPGDELMAAKYRIDLVFIKPIRSLQAALRRGRPRPKPVILAITPG